MNEPSMLEKEVLRIRHIQEQRLKILKRLLTFVICVVVIYFVGLIKECADIKYNGISDAKWEQMLENIRKGENI